MGNITRYVLILTIGIFAGAALTLERTVFAEREEALEPLPLEDLRTFAEIFGKIKDEYVEEIDDKKLISDAIQGMLAGLDPHSAYLDPDSFKQVRIGTEGQFGGLGIEVTMENGFVKVVAPIDDTPAAKAGLKPADLIIRLDDTPVKGMSLDEAVEIMRGEPGTDIQLTIVREGVDQPIVLTITRDIIRITSVKSSMLEPGYGYVRITQFQGSTAESLRAALSKLKEEAGGALDGLILDLRNNPGGVLNGAVGVSDAFLDQGVIVYTKGRADESQLRFTATPPDYLAGTPMVVLVNEGSASASEIVAGALQDHRRAIIMGVNTFGKGSVQTILPMNNGSALKLTTARYYTPDDRSIQALGIEPDVVVRNLQVTEAEGNGAQRVREADLARHLINENGEEDNGEESEDNGDSAGPSIEDDFQLREALNLLKGVNIVRANERR